MIKFDFEMLGLKKGRKLVGGFTGSHMKSEAG